MAPLPHQVSRRVRIARKNGITMKKFAILALGLVVLSAAMLASAGRDRVFGSQEDPLNVCREDTQSDGAVVKTCLTFDPAEKHAVNPINTTHEVTVKAEETCVLPDGAACP